MDFRFGAAFVLTVLLAWTMPAAENKAVNKHLKSACKALQKKDSERAGRELAAALAPAGAQQVRDPRLARALHGLGALHARENRLPDARKAFERAIAIHNEAGIRKAATAKILADLGDLYSRESRSDQAAKAYMEASAIWANEIGPDELLIAKLLRKAANAFETLGNVAESEKLRVRANSILEVRLGSEHATLAPALAALAEFHRRQKDLARAESVYSSSVALAEKALGPGHAYSRALRRRYERLLKKDASGDEQPPDALPQLPRYTVSIQDRSISEPQLKHRVEPAYTEAARQVGLEGTVVIFLVVNKQGHTEDLVVIEPLGLGLDERAIAALQQWQFRPGLKDNQPVAVAASVEITYRLLNRCEKP